jgi:hypothetical protein
MKIAIDGGLLNSIFAGNGFLFQPCSSCVLDQRRILATIVLGLRHSISVC